MVKYLEWDSNFFKLRIGKAIIASQQDMNNLIKIQSELSFKYDLIYVFASKGLLSPLTNSSLVDQKTIYKAKIEPISASLDDNIIKYEKKFVSDDLLNLALLSGEYSRFRLDKKLPNNAYERLYTCWIEQSVKHNIATEIFCYMVDDKPKGFLTLNRNDSKGIIGLVATDSNTRGRGIGSALLCYVKNYCFQSNIKELSVATQLHNKAACHLYEKAGFVMTSCTDIWHWWL